MLRQGRPHAHDGGIIPRFTGVEVVAGTGQGTDHRAQTVILTGEVRNIVNHVRQTPAHVKAHTYARVNDTIAEKEHGVPFEQVKMTFADGFAANAALLAAKGQGHALSQQYRVRTVKFGKVTLSARLGLKNGNGRVRNSPLTTDREGSG